MIVACPNCQSKYNLPEEKISPKGSKVRCARCKNVFTVSPPAAAPSTAPQAAPQAAPEDDFDKALAGLNAAAPESAAETSSRKMPWEDDEPAGPLGAPAASPAAPRKMPWEDDEPAAGPTDDDDALPAGPKAKSSMFDDDDAPAPSLGGDLDGDRPSRATGGKDDEFLGSLGGGDSLSLDGGKKATDDKAAKKKKMIVLGAGALVLLLIVAALAVFKPWTMMNIPFLGGAKTEKAADNADKVKDIALRNVRQYYIPNDKTGQIFVVEGKAVNNFAAPKERIKVEVTLFDEKGHVLVSKQMLCGNTLSQFQLQVQSEEEIGATLNSEVGILTSNTYLKTGMDTPFMAVFFKPPDTVKEFGVKVIDALDPK